MAFEAIYGYRAVESLLSIERYLQERSLSGAKNVLSDIKRSIDLLTIYPFLGLETEKSNFRFQVTQKYRYKIVYRVGNNAIHIFQVYHPKQSTNESDSIEPF